ncbi:MAG TPA: extracellular solute-binding protein, partial [Thiobacillaceae bacterium]|nr:extracellular solute-binding protein [Thiobacillaceae bacterium]
MPLRPTPFLISLLLLLSMATGGHAEDSVRVLRVLAWPGYADPDLVAVFEKRHNAKVEVTLVSTDDALREKLAANQGRDCDVIAANTAEIAGFIERDLLQPVDPARLPRTRDQRPRFRDTA